MLTNSRGTLSIVALGFFWAGTVRADSIETRSNPVAAGAIQVSPGDANRSDWDAIPSYEPDEDDVEFFPVDIDRVQIAHDVSNLYIRIRTHAWEVQEDWRVGTYIDTDVDTESGYSGGFLAVGAEFLLEGEIYEFTGGNSTEWSWGQIPGVARDQTTRTDVEVSIPRSILQNPSEVQLLFFANNFCCDFQMPDDVYPNGGATRSGNYFTYQLIDPQTPGDFDGNHVLDLADVNLLSRQIASQVFVGKFDVNTDGQVSLPDLVHWVTKLKRTWFGDADLSGEFNSSDLVAIFQAGKFESGAAATWAEGDWNGDLRFGSGDLVQAFQDGGFEAGRRAAVNSVPEPSGMQIVAIMCALMATRRGRSS